MVSNNIFLCCLSIFMVGKDFGVIEELELLFIKCEFEMFK